ncbi:hypothetical protein LCGC14_0453750 [marine sediment metagenome]|uniref:Uncharacterized protein n=1 Tax=marine sediment metagenome TaxID=412755 RepID=A0A0F9SGW3_9ZZZZ
MNLALGNECIVYDYSPHSDIPRAIWQGLEWIKYALNRIWFNNEIIPIINGHNCIKYFRICYNRLNKKTKKYIKYFKKFLNTDYLELVSITFNTKHDSDCEYYKRVVNKKVQGSDIRQFIDKNK